ncbi:MAG: DNA-binding protein [bacterium]|nr:DNA-binding protein [bacterium]
MLYKKSGRKFILSIEKGEEIVYTLKHFCIKQNIKSGFFTGIGATNKFSIGLFKTSTREYISKEFSGDHEISNLTGNISIMNKELYLHIHITLANDKYQAYGGHLNQATVSGACEIIIDPVDDTLEREFNNMAGLNIFKL